MMRKGTGDSSTSFNNYMVKGGSEAELSNGDSEIKNHKLCYGGDADDLLSSWPPRHYTCSFCRRRFKSAQALGGHMNVHRRARAMLRSQSMSPISSPPSSPWLHRTLTTAQPHHPFQHDHFIYPNPHCPSNHINLSHSNLSHLPIINISPSTTFKHKNPLSAPYKHLPETQFQHAELSHDIEKVKKYCFRAENSSTTVHQDDAVVRLSLGGSRPAVEEEDIDLELRLGF